MALLGILTMFERSVAQEKCCKEISADGTHTVDKAVGIFTAAKMECHGYSCRREQNTKK